MIIEWKKLLKNEKDFYNSFAVENIIKNKLFPRTQNNISPKKAWKGRKIVFLENCMIVSGESISVVIFGIYFANLVSCLNIRHPETTQLDPNLVINVIFVFEKHPIIL